MKRSKVIINFTCFYIRACSVASIMVSKVHRRRHRRRINSSCVIRSLLFSFDLIIVGLHFSDSQMLSHTNTECWWHTTVIIIELKLTFFCHLSVSSFHRLTRPGWIRSWGSALNCRWLTTWETTYKMVFSSPSWLKSWVSWNFIRLCFFLSSRRLCLESYF